MEIKTSNRAAKLFDKCYNFTRADEVEAAWRIVTPALTVWESPTNPADMPTHEAGTWEPEAAEQLLNRDGRRWRRL